MATLTVPDDAPLSGVVVDGVHRLQNTGISVLVVGGGVGGYMTALECWRQGHDVQVLEKASKVETIGDTFGLLPPGVSTFRFFPAMHKQFEAESYDAEMSAWSFDGQQLHHFGDAAWNQPQPDGLEHAAKGVRVPWIEARFKMALMLAAQCSRLGIPIHFGEEVVRYTEDATQGKAETKDGRVYCADIMVAADGVGTKSYLHVAGHAVRAHSSGYAAFRCIMPADEVRERVSLSTKEKFFQYSRPQMRFYLSPTMHANVIILPDLVFLMLTHKDLQGSEESWHARVSPQEVMQTLATQPGWDPAIVELFSLTPEDGCIDWKLVSRDPQPHWASEGGRVIQLGDAAHSFIPTSGNGATQAMEDAISLATCLRLAGRDSAHIGTKVHNKLRFERVSTLQHFGFVNQQLMHSVDLTQQDKESVKKGLIHSRWIWSHDPLKYAVDNFQDAYNSVVRGTPFENTNLPPGAMYQPWSIAEEAERMRKGIMPDLKEHGDWS